VIYARESVPAPLLDAVYGADLNGGPAPEEAVQNLLAAIQRSSAVERCYADAQALVAGARTDLALLPPGPAREALEELAEYVVTRRG
jgi:heptaprenyl diphosphate synthase